VSLKKVDSELKSEGFGKKFCRPAISLIRFDPTSGLVAVLRSFD
jgi:hypothetical protein